MNIFKINIFYKPIKSDVLVFDFLSLKFAKKLFLQKKLSIFHTRFDGVSIYILIKTIFKSGFVNLFKNYKINFFHYVNPKIIYTAIDNHEGFYKLKEIYPKAKYVSDQNGARDPYFYNILKSKKNNKLKYFADAIFCFGENEKKRLSKIIDANIYPLGHTINNSTERFKLKKFKFQNLVYISGWKRNLLRREKALQILINTAIEMNKNFYFIERPNENFKYLLDKKKSSHIKYIPNRDFKDKKFYKNSIFISENSTLLYQMLSKNYRVIFFGKEFIERNNFLNFKYKANGPFWCYMESETKFKDLLNKVKNYDQTKWNKISNKYSCKFLKYDRNNSKKKAILNNFLH